MPPTSSSYTAGIDVVTRDADGVFTKLAGETVKIRYADGSHIVDVVSDDFGFIDFQLLASVPSETLVEFYSATKTGTLRMTTARTAEEAFSVLVTLVLDDAFITTKTADFGDVYLRDNTDANIPLEFLGSQPKDSTRLYLKETALPKDYDIFVVPRTKDFEFGKSRPEDSAVSSLSAVGGLSDQIEIDVTEIISGTVGKGLYHKTGNVIGEFDISFLGSQTANQAFASPNGASGVPSFRSLVAADIPNLDASKITSGIFGHARLGTGGGGSTKFLREDNTWQTIASGITVGNAVTGGGANRVLYEDGSQNLAASANFTYDGTSLSLINATAASSGSPAQNPPYINLQGQGWLGGANRTVELRIKNEINARGEAGFVVYESVASYVANEIFSVKGHPSTGLTTRVLFSSPANPGSYGGILDVTYDGIFTFRDLAGAQSGLSPAYISWNQTQRNFESADFGYSTVCNVFSGGHFTVTAGGAATLNLYYKYDGSNYYSATVDSAGTVTFNAVGSAPKFVFADDVELSSGKKLTVGGTQFRGYTTSASAPSTTELPNDKDWSFHNDTGAVEKSIAINFGGTIYGIVLPAV